MQYCVVLKRVRREERDAVEGKEAKRKREKEERNRDEKIFSFSFGKDHCYIKNNIYLFLKYSQVIYDRK